jgi:prepilin signal peptidase PulO-like enzyme (type II secretory pathway)
MNEVFLVAATVYVALIGLFLGSFINLAADRVPRGESVVSPRSHCRACGRVLDAVDLLPVLGYLIRGGRCASCRAPIGAGQPIVELVAGSTMLVPVLVVGLWPGALIGLAATAILGAAIVTAARRRAQT